LVIKKKKKQPNKHRNPKGVLTKARHSKIGKGKKGKIFLVYQYSTRMYTRIYFVLLTVLKKQYGN